MGPFCFSTDVNLQKAHLSVLVQCAEGFSSPVLAAAFIHRCTASLGWGGAWRGGDRCGPVKGSPTTVPAAAGVCIGARVGAARCWHGGIRGGAKAVPALQLWRPCCSCGDLAAAACFVRGAGWNQCRGLQSSPVSSSLFARIIPTISLTGVAIY